MYKMNPLGKDYVVRFLYLFTLGFWLYLSPVSLFAFECPGGVGNIDPIECESIKAVYNATGGSTTWSCGNRGNPDPFFDRLYCGVYIKCSGTNATADRHVTSISLPYCDMTGSLPADAFAKIPYLYYLNLAENKLTGSIPSSLSSLIYLTYLDLGHNLLSGTIPESLLGDKTSSTVPPPYTTISRKLSVRDNALTGVLPNSIGRNDMQYLLFDENSSLAGPIPQSYSQQTNTSYLMFDYSDTAVCEPQNQSMQTWLNTVIAHIGSNIDCGTTPLPSTPKSLNASDGTSDISVNVTWKASNYITERYYIERSQDKVNWTTIAKKRSAYESIVRYGDKSVNQLAGHYYRVKACDGDNNCSGYSNIDLGYKILTNPAPITSIISNTKKDPKKLQVEFTWTDTADLKGNTPGTIANYNYYKFFIANQSGFKKSFSQNAFHRINIPGDKWSYTYAEKTFQDPYPQFKKLTQRAVAVQACGPVLSADKIIHACSSAALANVKVSMPGIFNILLQSTRN